MITHEHIPDVSLRLLERLLKSARSQQWSQSVFCLQAVGPDSQAAKPNSSPTSSDPEQLLIDLMKASSEQTKSKANEFKIVPETSKMSQFKVEVEIPRADELKIAAETARTEKKKMPAEFTKAELSRMAAELTMLSEQEDTESKENVQSKHQPKSRSSQPAFEQCLQALPEVLVEKLEELTKEGGEAFARRDLKSAQDILTLSNRLNEFKIELEEIMTAFKIQH